jgi:hypothetical protein
MGKGTDAARADAPEHAALMDDLKDQLLIVFLRRLGGKISIPVAEIDGTGGLLFLLSAEDGMFNFELRPKQ